MKKGISDKGIKRIASCRSGQTSFEIGPTDEFWVVIDPPSSESELEDVVWDTNLRRLGDWFVGGISRGSSQSASDINMVLYSDEGDAVMDAQERLEWLREKEEF